MYLYAYMFHASQPQLDHPNNILNFEAFDYAILFTLLFLTVS
jgi:hypothetical protein